MNSNPIYSHDSINSIMDSVETNPAVNNPAETNPATAIAIVYCVVDTYDDLKLPWVRIIKSYCLNNSITFMSHRFDSITHRYDRNYITALPAFHIYNKKLYETTFYANEESLDIIDDCLEKFHVLKEKKSARISIWPKTIIARLFPKKIFTSSVPFK